MHTHMQELRIKEFKQQLELVLGDYYSVKSSIDPSIQSLMTPHLEVVLRSLLPGWTTLTWNTMNIDAFLHHVQSCIKTLEVMATRVSSILKEKVYGTITLITEMTLFDVGLATSRTWVSIRHSDTQDESCLFPFFLSFFLVLFL